MAKLSNFRDYAKVMKSALETTQFATVDVTTGFFRKKTVARRIVKTGISWFFMDTGYWTTGQQAEALARAYFAQEVRDNG